VPGLFAASTTFLRPPANGIFRDQAGGRAFRSGAQEDRVDPYVPLEPEAAEILKPLTQKGPVIACCDNHLYIKRRELARDMRIKLPENCLRNSYATYALTFRSIGEVAKAMGGRRVNCEALLRADP
jgi:hypothetical protein